MCGKLQRQPSPFNHIFNFGKIARGNGCSTQVLCKLRKTWVILLGVCLICTIDLTSCSRRGSFIFFMGTGRSICSALLTVTPVARIRSVYSRIKDQILLPFARIWQFEECISFIKDLSTSQDEQIEALTFYMFLLPRQFRGSFDERVSVNTSSALGSNSASLQEYFTPINSVYTPSKSRAF